jgi:hypothetical protein
MDLYERYQEGHFGDTMGPSLAAPQWARALGWDGLGCWAVIKQADLLAAVPGLTIHAIKNQPAVLVIRHPPSDVLAVQQFFEELENRNLNVVALAKQLWLVCLGATLVRTSNGLTQLVGIFELQAQNRPDLPVLHVRIPNRLILTSGPGSAELPTDMVEIPYFKVPARVTMNSSLIAGMTEEEYSSVPMPSRRRSMIGSVFLSRNTQGADIEEQTADTSSERKTKTLTRMFSKRS